MTDTAAVLTPLFVPLTARPVLIDPADGPCEVCAAWEAARAKAGRHVCNQCGGPILDYQNMGGNGFQSVRPHHFHLERVADAAGRRAKFAELCHECYLADYRAAYPDAPAPRLPMVLMDPNAPRDTKLFRPPDGEVVQEYAE